MSVLGVLLELFPASSGEAALRVWAIEFLDLDQVLHDLGILVANGILGILDQSLQLKRRVRGEMLRKDG